jgi:hypothetical protein
MAKRQSPDRLTRRPEKESEHHVVIPAITHLQFLALDLLTRKPDGLSAQQLNVGLAEFAPEYRGPKFYQLMKRLVEAGLVEAWSQPFDVGGTTVSRTFYRIATPGTAAWRITTEFYRVRLAITRGMHSSGK